MEKKRKSMTHEEAMERLERQIKADTRKPITLEELEERMRKRDSEDYSLRNTRSKDAETH